MIVCICNSVKEEDIIDIVEEYDIKEINELQDKISICNQCCMCKCYIDNLIDLLQNESMQKAA